MPKSKLNGRTKYKKPVHFNPFANVLVGKARTDKYGKRSKPIPGSTLRVNNVSPYMGSVVTPGNRRKYEKAQWESFAQRYVADIVTKREVIEAQEDKTDEEIEIEVNDFNREQITDDQLVRLSERFARYQSNKEQKHYKAWFSGKSTFTYKGQAFPVLTERWLEEHKSIKDIVKVEDGE